MPQWLLHPTPKVLPASSPSKHLRGWLLSLSIILSCLWKRSCWIKQYSHLASSSNQHWTGAGLRFWWLATNQDDVLCKHTINYIYIYIPCEIFCPDCWAKPCALLWDDNPWQGLSNTCGGKLLHTSAWRNKHRSMSSNGQAGFSDSLSDWPTVKNGNVGHAADSQDTRSI